MIAIDKPIFFFLLEVKANLPQLVSTIHPHRSFNFPYSTIFEARLSISQLIKLLIQYYSLPACVAPLSRQVLGGDGRDAIANGLVSNRHFDPHYLPLTPSDLTA